MRLTGHTSPLAPFVWSVFCCCPLAAVFPRPFQMCAFLGFLGLGRLHLLSPLLRTLVGTAFWFLLIIFVFVFPVCRVCGFFSHN